MRNPRPAPPAARIDWRAGPEGDGPFPLAGRVESLEDQGERGRGGGGAGRRILSLWLPAFALERRLALMGREAPPADQPFALAVEGTHGPVVHAVNAAAREAGARPGGRVVDARAACPALRVDPADLPGDAAALFRLSLWLRRWCPWTAVDGIAGVLLDVTGSTHLWGGEAGLLAQVEERLGAQGLTSALAIAPTTGAAWALARFGGPRAACRAEALAGTVAPLPVRALRLSPDAALLLGRLGLKTVGDLAGVPRLPLARRFVRAEPGDNPLHRLDQMMGRVPEPLDCPDDPPRFAVQAQIAEAVLDPAPWVPALARSLAEMLEAKGFGARRLVLTVYRSDGMVSSVEAAVSRASRDPDHMARLFEGRLERIDPGFGFDLVTLAAAVAERVEVRQPRLDGGTEGGEDLARLVDRLAARFGPRALLRPALRESHVPERREALVPALWGAPEPPMPAGPRPLRLFEPPERIRVVYAVPEGPPAQFVWRRITHRVARFAGPERIAPEWWRDRPGTRLRDYYRVEDQDGRRFWIFREGIEGDGRGGRPEWFVHGAFG